MPGHDRIRLIDPASYQGPSAFEGLGSLLNTINTFAQQEKAEEQAIEERDYQRDQDALAIERADRIREEEVAFREQKRLDEIKRQDMVDLTAAEERERLITQQETAELRSQLNAIETNPLYANDPTALALAMESNEALSNLPEYASRLKSYRTIGVANQNFIDISNRLGDVESYTAEEARQVEQAAIKANASDVIIKSIRQKINDRVALDKNIPNTEGYKLLKQTLLASEEKDSDGNNLYSRGTGILSEVGGVEGRVLTSAGIDQLRNYEANEMQKGAATEERGEDLTRILDDYPETFKQDGKVYVKSGGETIQIGNIKDTTEILPGADKPFDFQDTTFTFEAVADSIGEGTLEEFLADLDSNRVVDVKREETPYTSKTLAEAFFPGEMTAEEKRQADISATGIQTAFAGRGAASPGTLALGTLLSGTPPEIQPLDTDEQKLNESQNILSSLFSNYDGQKNLTGQALFDTNDPATIKREINTLRQIIQGNKRSSRAKEVRKNPQKISNSLKILKDLENKLIKGEEVDVTSFINLIEN
tara:strand:- start:1540 stop:3150 length:1611 start_codon:yes stop_codon:yes gene_type:complete